ncbi:site-2 protease family protein [Alicyclobacillus mengziensis]|uniref:Site-2 protease family protein n=1 Tax=Alicyclobacillus mengziensis TaxID=2931921 RepID=A0A9X7VW87_9BACL|nr:site-2 protease family protein [Alicyclobacillus mengziensis]QSO45779.1 site-2 protease family protein [Alicyclobacillus mengziensis]
MIQSLIDPAFLFRFIAVLVGLVIHEFAHAVTADVLGDKTARVAGRVTLNPLAHLDPLGLIMILFAPIGWAKPTPVNASRLRHPRSGMVMVALAGPISNLIISIVCLTVFSVVYPVSTGGFLAQLLWWGGIVNLFLFIFNLIPIQPLDGSRVVASLLPYRLELKYRKLDLYGPFILLLLVIIPPLRNHILYPILNGVLALMLHIFGISGI